MNQQVKGAEEQNPLALVGQLLPQALHGIATAEAGCGLTDSVFSSKQLSNTAEDVFCLLNVIPSQLPGYTILSWIRKHDVCFLNK